MNQTRSKIAIGAALALAVGVGVYLVPTPPPVRTVTLAWGDGGNPPDTIYEIWSTTNLIAWQLHGTTTQTSYTVPATNRQEFFKLRAVETWPGGDKSDWSHK